MAILKALYYTFQPIIDLQKSPSASLLHSFASTASFETSASRHHDIMNRSNNIEPLHFEEEHDQSSDTNHPPPRQTSATIDEDESMGDDAHFIDLECVAISENDLLNGRNHRMVFCPQYPDPLEDNESMEMEEQRQSNVSYTFSPNEQDQSVRYHSFVNQTANVRTVSNRDEGCVLRIQKICKNRSLMTTVLKGICKGSMSLLVAYALGQDYQYHFVPTNNQIAISTGDGQDNFNEYVSAVNLNPRSTSRHLLELQELLHLPKGQLYPKVDMEGHFSSTDLGFGEDPTNVDAGLNKKKDTLYFQLFVGTLQWYKVAHVQFDESTGVVSKDWNELGVFREGKWCTAEPVIPVGRKMPVIRNQITGTFTGDLSNYHCGNLENVKAGLAETATFMYYQDGVGLWRKIDVDTIGEVGVDSVSVRGGGVEIGTFTAGKWCIADHVGPEEHTEIVKRGRFTGDLSKDHCGNLVLVEAGLDEKKEIMYYQDDAKEWWKIAVNIRDDGTGTVLSVLKDGAEIGNFLSSRAVRP